MALIEWKKDYAVDIAEIDLQHRRLVDLLNALHDAMRQGKGNEAVGKILKDTIAYTQTHFATEEKIMRASGYPDLEAHLREHADLVAKAQDVAKRFETQKGAAVTIEVLNFLRDWLTKHILGTDKKYAPFLHGKGVK